MVSLLGKGSGRIQTELHPRTDTPGNRIMRDGVLQGYEGELELLIKACKRGFGVVVIPIATRYAEGCPANHCRPVRDT
jgi:hypothetical protein